MRNASGAADKNPRTITRPGCPAWCSRHADYDLGRPDAFRTHHSARTTAGGVTVELDRSDDLDGTHTGTTAVLVNGSEMTPRQARTLAAALLRAADEAGR